MSTSRRGQTSNQRELLADCAARLDEIWQAIDVGEVSDDTWSRLTHALAAYNRALAHDETREQARLALVR